MAEIKIPKEAMEIIKNLENAGYEAVLVGGCVRDSILGRTPHDWDIATAATPEKVMDLFGNTPIITTGLKHGTVTIIKNEEKYEVTTFRTEGTYADNRHPDHVSFTSDLKKDLSRRDFTINAIAYSPYRGYTDPFGGIKDIEDKIIRCVGDPKSRFSEDALRILRAWRFSIQLDFQIAENTIDAMKTQIEKIKSLSAERIQWEFRNAVSCNPITFQKKTKSMQWILSAIFPEWEKMDMDQKNPYHVYTVADHCLFAFARLPKNADLVLRIAALMHDIGKPSCYADYEDGTRHFHGHAEKSAEIMETIMQRLKFDNETKNDVVQLIRYHDVFFDESEKQIKHWLNKIGETQLRRLFILRKCDILAQSPLLMQDRFEKVTRLQNTFEKVLKEKQCFTMKDLAISGKDIMEYLDLQPGEEIGKIKNALLTQVIEGTIKNTKADLLSAIPVAEKIGSLEA